MVDLLFLLFLCLAIFEIAVAVSYVAVAGLVLKEIKRGNDHIQIRLPHGYMPEMLFNRHPVVTSFFLQKGAFGFFVQLGVSGFWSSMAAVSLAFDLGKVATVIAAGLFFFSVVLYYLISSFVKLMDGKKVLVGMERGP